MKTSIVTLALSLAFGFETQAQLATDLNSTSDSAGALAGPDSNRPPDDIGPNHRGWTVAEPGAGPGRESKHFVELATGLNVWDSSSKSWRLSSALFEPSEEGGAFVANHVQHKVRLSEDLYVAGSVRVTLPDGLVISSSPSAIALLDAASGKSAIVAVLTNTSGFQISSNQVVYERAFVGACADISFAIDRATFSQDVIFTGRFDPMTYGFSTNFCRIQILTEMFSVPEPDLLVQPISVEGDPAARAKLASPDLMDESIGFENFVFGTGRAYVFPSAEEPEGAGAAVAKEFIRTQDGRAFLVETIDYASLAKALMALPDCNPPDGPAQYFKKEERQRLYAAIPSLGAARQAKGPSVRPANASSKLASRQPRTGVVIDYIANIGGSLTGNVLFAGNTNYFVNGAVFCNGPTTMEAAVFKYPTNGTPYVQLNNAVTWKTSIYRPAVFTGVDDDSIGDSFATWPGSNYKGAINPNGYANPAIYMGQTTLTLNNCRFCYAKQAVRYVSASPSTAATLTVNHSQFVNCIRGIELDGSGSGTGIIAVNVNNSLMASVQNPVMGGSPGNPVNLALINCTVDQGVRLVGGSWGGAVTLNSINSIFANLTNSTTSATLTGKNNGFYTDAQTFGSPLTVVSGNPFQQAGAGFYYVTDASGFRNGGTSSGVSGSLKADLAKRTTYPPLVTAQATLTNSQTLSPQAQKDTDVLDIGYHYDPLDYAFGWVLVTNATLTVTNGTAIAAFGTNGGTYGLAIGRGATLASQGAPNLPNWIVQYNTVQEQPYTNWFRTANGLVSSEFQGSSPASVINCRFTDFSVPSLDAPAFVGPTNSGPFNFQDCEFHGGKLISTRPTVNLTNCLLERVYTDLEPKDGLTTSLRVGLVYGGSFTFAPSNSVVQDVLFDGAVISNWNGYNGSFNAYVTNLTRLQPTKVSDILLSASPSYQAGPLGPYYQLNTSPLVNFDTGTTANQIGLYHYTVTTNLVGGFQIKETNTLVDVSYHYVAGDSSGNPTDGDGDTRPDYLEDSNGDGTFNAGDLSDWRNYNSPNGLVTGSGLTVFTPLK